MRPATRPVSAPPTADSAGAARPAEFQKSVADGAENHQDHEVLPLPLVDVGAEDAEDEHERDQQTAADKGEDRDPAGDDQPEADRDDVADYQCPDQHPNQIEVFGDD